MLKKIISIVLICLLLIGVVSCGGKMEPAPTGGETPTTKEEKTTKPASEGSKAVAPGATVIGDFSIALSSVERGKNVTTLYFAVTKVGDTGTKAGATTITLIDDHDNKYRGDINILDEGSPVDFLSLLPSGFTYVVSVAVTIPEIAPISKFQLGKAEEAAFNDIKFVKPTFKSDFGTASINAGASVTLGKHLTLTFSDPACGVIGWVLPVIVKNAEYNPIDVGVRIGLQFPNGNIIWSAARSQSIEGLGQAGLEPMIITLSQALEGLIPAKLLIHCSEGSSREASLKVMNVTANEFPPLSERIAFNGTDGDLYIARADGSGKTRIVDNSGFTPYGSNPDWSPNGTKIVVDGIVGTTYILIADGTSATKLTWTGHNPAWSPDGKKIAFNDMGVVRIANADGSGEIQRVSPTENEYEAAYYPDWSPDGSRLVYRDYLAARKIGIYTIASDGTGTPTLLAEGDNPTWSPTGEKVAFEYNGDIYTINIDGTGKTKVVSGNNPAWSPDGKRLVFDFNKTVYMINVDGSEKRELFEGEHPSWAPAFKLL